jgi:hypothetical protein
MQFVPFSDPIMTHYTLLLYVNDVQQLDRCTAKTLNQQLVGHQRGWMHTSEPDKQI